MKNFNLFILLVLLSTPVISLGQNPSVESQNLLFKLKTESDCSNELITLSEIHEDTLWSHLNNEDLRKAFWINIYNAFIILKIRNFPKIYKNQRTQFFKKDWITIAEHKLSFDDIEHGILRRSKNKTSRGYLNKVFYKISPFERKFRVAHLDFRIHFALNCGAVSCPPIAFYSANKLDEQLDIAQNNFLTTDSKYVAETNTLYVSKIFFWFIHDFGGRRGLIELHRKLEIVPLNSKPKVTFKVYDWHTIY